MSVLWPLEISSLQYTLFYIHQPKHSKWQQPAYQPKSSSFALGSLVWGEQGAQQVVWLYPANAFCQTEAQQLSAPLPDLAETGQWAQEKDCRISEASFLHKVGLKMLSYWKERKTREQSAGKFWELSNRYPTASETRLGFVIQHFYTAGHGLPQNNNCAQSFRQFTAFLKFSSRKGGESSLWALWRTKGSAERSWKVAAAQHAASSCWIWDEFTCRSLMNMIVSWTGIITNKINPTCTGTTLPNQPLKKMTNIFLLKFTSNSSKSFHKLGSFLWFVCNNFQCCSKFLVVVCKPLQKGHTFYQFMFLASLQRHWRGWKKQ